MTTDGNINQNNISQPNFINGLFSGKYPATYDICLPGTTNACPWIEGTTLYPNTILYHPKVNTSVALCSVCINPDGQWDKPINDANNICDFQTIKDKYFFQGRNDDFQAMFYISKDSVSHCVGWQCAESYILLSMETGWSAARKGHYVADKKLGGAIAWMLSGDTTDPSDQSNSLIRNLAVGMGIRKP